MLATIEADIDTHILDQLRAVPVRQGVPLLAVDADEVLVYLADHLKRYLEGIGYRMQLTHYQLEGSILPMDSDEPVPFDGCLALIDRFFEEETPNQQAVPGAAETLERLLGGAQVMVLTNVPGHAAAMRRENLAALGMGYPMVANAGGKGRALRWLAERAQAPVVFIDDSPKQHESAARRAPEVTRIHFVGASHVRRIHVDSPAAHHRVEDWTACEAVVRRTLAI